ncbi:Nn.00g109570.m01.CDS01 [Neocucurbitaria sp. VM-36]
MSQNEKDSLPPPYSETYTTRTISTSRGQNILDQLTLTRAHHIQSVIDTHIIPLVEAQASYGIAQTTIAMLPSDIPLPVPEEKSEFSFDTGDSKAVEVIGYSSQDEPKVVRLEGMMNRTEFWRPQAVIVELERVLRESLNASSYLRSPTSAARLGRSEFEAPLQQPRRNFLSRLVPSLGPEERSPSGNPEVGTKQLDYGGLVLVKVRLEEICLRTVNEFGLYDTMSKQCIIIRVDARC